MDLDLKGKNALVGGSSKGIGKAVAIELSKLGASVTLIARNPDTLSNTLDELHRSLDQDHDFLVADFSNYKDVKKKVKGLVMNKPIHILVNNTGGPPGGPITEAKNSEFLQAFNNHLICNQMLMKAVLPGMKAAGYGRIINIISTSVKQPIAGLGVSNTIRAAVANWAKTLAGETGPFGITVNNILPGFTMTDRAAEVASLSAEKLGKTTEEVFETWKATIPLRRIAEPREIAYAAAFLATPAAAYINGINLPVDGGKTMSL